MKLISSVVVTLMTAALLALGVSAPAQAYHPSVATFCDAWAGDSSIRVSQRGRTNVRVSSEYGRSPDARISISVRRTRTGRTVASVARRYDGGRETYRLPRLSRGRYRVVVRVDPYAHRFYGCSAAHGLRVRR